PWTGSGFSVENSTTILLGDDWSDKEDLIDPDPDKYASAGGLLTLPSTIWIEVQDDDGYVDAGSYAGFVINDFDVLSLGSGMEVTTYLNGNQQETYEASNLVTTLLNGGKRQIGFVTTKDFDRIRLTAKSGLSLGGSIEVYYAQVLR